MRALRRRRGLKRLAALAAVCTVTTVIVTMVFALPDTEASRLIASGPVPGVETTLTTGPSFSTTDSVSPGSVTTLTESIPTSKLPSTTTTTIYVHPILDPTRIVIPAIEVDARIILVGLLENGDMQVPSFGLAGWYELGPAPGAGGPAVIVAHVDSKQGPDVFYRLKKLESGDKVTIYSENGDAAIFVVDSIEQRLKSDLPTDRIWNDTWEPVIRLITCGGDFDRQWGHYLSNVIVFGHLLE